MAEELEIKLTLTGEGLEQAFDWLRTRPEATFTGEKTLINRYYDTPDCELNRQKAALRVRQAGDRFIQTLKTQGEFVSGAHRRQEWEWPLSTAELSLGLLAETPLSDRVDLGRLRPVFETNFRRRVIMLREGQSEIEVAIDHGRILSTGEERPLYEVEFELKSGDPARLIAWAEKLAAEVPVFLNLVSKAEQGYYLAGLHQPEIPGVRGKAPVSVTEFLYGLSVSWLTCEPYPIKELDLSVVREAAVYSENVPRLGAVIDRLEGGQAVATLMEDGVLGQIQVALATS